MLEKLLELFEGKKLQELITFYTNLSFQKLHLENELFRKKLEYFDFNNRAALEKQELELYKNNEESLKLKEQIDELNISLKCARLMIEYLKSELKITEV